MYIDMREKHILYFGKLALIIYDINNLMLEVFN